MKILITTANGMFGGAVLRHLAGKDIQVRALVRDPAKLPNPPANVEVFQGDLNDPASVARAVAGMDRVFLSTPMDEHIRERECRVIDAAAEAGVRHVVKIYGAVKHGDDPLVTQHKAAIERLKQTGMDWTLVSPNSVMETSFLSVAEWIVEESAFFGMSGHGKVGFVALEDVARVAATVLTSEGHGGQNYELTGPVSLDMFEVAAIFTEVLGRPIVYNDMTEEAYVAMIQPFVPLTPEQIETQIVCHYRCWLEGKAELHTDNVEKVTGEKPTPLAAFVEAHRKAFGG